MDKTRNLVEDYCANCLSAVLVCYIADHKPPIAVVAPDMTRNPREDVFMFDRASGSGGAIASLKDRPVVTPVGEWLDRREVLWIQAVNLDELLCT